MRERMKHEENVTRLLDVVALSVYLNMGQTNAKKFGLECGAKRKIGRRTLYDKKIIDKALDEMDE